MAVSVIKPRVCFVNINVSGASITNAENGWYWYRRDISSNLPSGAKPIGVTWEGSFDTDVLLDVSQNKTLILRSYHSKTLGTRSVTVVYTT